MTVRIKICGIVHPDDAVAAVDAGADLIGLNFVPGSPRRLSLDVAEQIASRVAGQVERVAVFQNASWDEIERVTRRVDLERIQLHGDETEQDVEMLDYPVIKAVRGADREAAETYPGTMLLLDHPTARRRPGPGLELGGRREPDRRGRGHHPGRRARAGQRGPGARGARRPAAVGRRRRDRRRRRGLPQGRRAHARLRRGGAQRRRRASERRAAPCRGRFGPYGGRYVPETLVAALDELEAAIREGRAERGLPARARSCCSRTTPAVRRRSIARAA